MEKHIHMANAEPEEPEQTNDDPVDVIIIQDPDDPNDCVEIPVWAL